MPLKGRHLHTLRFLWHANRVQMPYHFLVADGLVHPAVAQLLEQPGRVFPNLSLEYVKYPDDRTLSDFYRKMADASSKVRTPYVMHVDNDDFPILSGINRSIAFLEQNKDFVSSGGIVGGFLLAHSAGDNFSEVASPLLQVTSRCMPEYTPMEYSALPVADRIRSGFRQIHVHWYSVHRSEVWATIHRELAKFDLTDLHIHEVYIGMRAVTLGKTRYDGTAVNYMRQAGTGTPISSRIDMANHLVRSRLAEDLDTVIGHMCEILSYGESIDVVGFSEELRNLYAEKLRMQLHAHFHSAPIVRRSLRSTLANMLPSGLANRIRLNRSRDGMFRDIRASGVNGEVLTAFFSEWLAIEDTLANRKFRDFVEANAPSLLDDGWASFN